LNEKKKSGRAISPDALKVRFHLASLSPEALKEVTAKVYRKRTHHVGCTDSIFNMEKMRAKKALGMPKRAIAPRGSKPAKAPKALQVHKAVARLPAPGRSFEILAQVDLAAYSAIPAALLKTFAADLLKQCLNAPGLQLMMLQDPPAMEIRRPAYG